MKKIDIGGAKVPEDLWVHIVVAQVGKMFQKLTLDGNMFPPSRVTQFVNRWYVDSSREEEE